MNDSTTSPSHSILMTTHDIILHMTHLEGGCLDLVCVLVQLHVAQHHHARQQKCGGIGQVLAGDIRGRPVHSLENGAISADVAAGSEAETADEAGAEVGEDVTVEVGHDEDVVLAGVLHHVEAYSVQVFFLELDSRMFLGCLSTAL